MPGSVIVSTARTPIGKLSGALSSLSAMDLGGVAIKGALERAGVGADQVDYVIMGHVLQAGQGQITARQAAAKAGIPMTVPALTVNKVCLSGINAIYLADQMIAARRRRDVVVAGGMESMTNAPYLLPNAAPGYRMGNGELIDSLIHDGLWCAFEMEHMGAGTQRYANEHEVDRAAQDELAAKSHERAAAAIKAGRLADEITPVAIPQRKGDPVVFDEDEGVRPGTTAESLAPLRPAFSQGRHHHRGQRVADLRRRRGDDRHQPREGRGARPHADRRARRVRHGRRSRPVAAAPAVAGDQAGARPGEPAAHRRRPLRDQRGLRRGGDRVDARPRHQRRRRQRQRRGDRARPPSRHVRRPHRRLDHPRAAPPRRRARRRRPLRRWRPGRRRADPCRGTEIPRGADAHRRGAARVHTSRVARRATCRTARSAGCARPTRARGLRAGSSRRAPGASACATVGRRARP